MMTREELEAALEDDWHHRTKRKSDVVDAAARKQLAQLKRDCRDCEGTGEEWASEARVDTQECFVCGGSGKVYPPETVEKIARLIHSWDDRRNSLLSAVALLDVLGESQ